MTVDGALTSRQYCSWTWIDTWVALGTHAFGFRARVQASELGEVARTGRPRHLGTTGSLWKGDGHGRLAGTKTDEVALVPCAVAAVPGPGVGVVLLDVGDRDTVGRGDAGAGIAALDGVGETDPMAGRQDSRRGRGGQEEPAKGDNVKFEKAHLA